MEYSSNISLEEAVKRSDVKAVQELLEKGADPNYKPRSYDSLMHLALKKKHVEVIKLLVQYGAKVKQHFLSEIFNFNSIEISKEFVTQIIKYNEDVEVIIKIFMQLTYCKSTEPLMMHMLKLLLNHGLPVDDPIDSQSRTPLHYSILSNKADFVSVFLTLGADIHKKASGDHDSLSFATIRDITNLKILKMLLKSGAGFNRVRNGKTLLHRTCYYGSKKTLRFLLELGADVNILNNNGQTPLQCAFLLEHIRIFLKDLAVKSFAGQLVSNKNLEHIRQNQDMQITFEECLWELKELKNFVIFNGLSLYDILRIGTDCKKLLMLAKNENFVAKFQSWNRKSYEYYGPDLDEKMKDVFERKNVLLDEEKYLYSILKDSLPELVIRKVALFANEDLFTYE